ncbi:carbohydrate ABC transporter permease [Halomicroarcula sp. GCM10025710]
MALFPIYWILTSSLKSPNAIVTVSPSLVPALDTLTLQHYQAVLDGQMPDYFLNSVIVTLTTMVTSVILAVFAGYGWAKFEFRGSRFTSTFVILSRIFPIVVILVPMFQILRSIGALNSHPGLVLSYFVYTLPLTAWMLKGFFENIPDNVIRAARVDGFSEFRIFLEIVLPMVRPGIIATALFSVVIAWQELVFALTFLQDDELYTMPVALVGLTNQYDIQWGLMMASSFAFMLPVAVLFLLTQNYFIKGITGGAAE